MVLLVSVLWQKKKKKFSSENSFKDPIICHIFCLLCLIKVQSDLLSLKTISYRNLWSKLSKIELYLVPLYIYNIHDQI